MEIEALNLLNENLYPSVLQMIKVILLGIICLTLAGFVIYLLGIAWFCYEERRLPMRGRAKPARPARPPFNRNQITYGETMKQNIVRTFSLLALLLTGAVVTAQAQPTTRLTVDVPFDFTVNNQNLPAGQYQVHLRENRQLAHLRISRADQRKSVIVFSLRKEARTSPTNSAVLFRRYGNRYFLGEVWARGESSGHEIAHSKAEKQLRQQIRKEHLRKDHLAARPSVVDRTEVVLLAASQ